MLHVAFFELTRRGENDLMAGDLWIGIDQCHDILQLIAESEGAARLIKSGAAPDAAGPGLVEHPMVEDGVHGVGWCLHLHYRETLPPAIDGMVQRLLVG